MLGGSMKALLTAQELVAHMKKKGIGFTIVNEENAEDFLQHHNYYLKLASYRENYKKYSTGDKAGQYINLEFAYLKELSTLDMHLRYLVLQMTLDIEHFLKVSLLQHIEQNPKEDGYRLIQRFLAKDQNINKLRTIQAHKASDYCRGLIDKYYPYFPAWVYVELISFGELTHLCAFYDELYKDPIADNILLNSVRDIRNASAHSNCLLNRLSVGGIRADTSIKRRVKQIPTIGENALQKKLSNKCICDFCCLLFTYDELITSEVLKEKRFTQLKEFFENRMVQHKDWFETNNTIISAYQFTKKVLDYFITK